jgi:hypothetical protein
MHNTLARFATTLLAFFVFGLALAGDMIPFKGSGSGIVISAYPNSLIVSTGHSTLLGRFTRRESIDSIDGDGVVHGRVDFMVETGDHLSVHFVGQFTSETTIEGTYTVVDGWGRFEGVTGSADFIAVSPDGIHVTYEFDGFLSGFPG